MPDKFEQKWTIAAFFETPPSGLEFYHTKTPLHVTFAGVFKTPQSCDELATGLAAVAKKHSVLSVVGEQEEYFGPNQDIPVTTLQSNEKLTKLHYDIYKWLTQNSAVFNNPEFVAQGFRPHCTAQANGQLAIGQKQLLSSLSLVDMFPNGDGLMRRVHATVPFA